MLMVLGLAFLAANLGLVDDIGRLWPAAVIALGVALLIDRLRS